MNEKRWHPDRPLGRSRFAQIHHHRRVAFYVVGILGGMASILFWQASRTLREELLQRSDWKEKKHE